MKIVLLGDSLATQDAGIHYYGLQLVAKVAAHYSAHDLYIVLPWQLTNITNLGITPIIIPLRKGIPFHLRIRQIINIPNRLRKLAPDVVIELAHFGPFRLPKNTIRITVIHDLTPVHHPQFHDRLSVLMHRLLLPQIIKNADLVWTNSQTTKAAIAKDYPIAQNQIVVVYPSVVPPSCEEASTMPMPRHPYFLSVGTLEPRKNLKVVLKAFELYCNNHGDGKTQLILTGGRGWKDEAFRNALKNSTVREQIIIMGRVERSTLWDLYRGALALVSASHTEGFGLPCLEAMSSQLPLILSDIPIYHEVAGGAALYFPPDDEEALARHFQTIATDQAQTAELRKQSQEQYLLLKSFDPDWPPFEGV